MRCPHSRAHTLICKYELSNVYLTVKVQQEHLALTFYNIYSTNILCQMFFLKGWQQWLGLLTYDLQIRTRLTCIRALGLYWIYNIEIKVTIFTFENVSITTIFEIWHTTLYCILEVTKCKDNNYSISTRFKLNNFICLIQCLVTGSVLSRVLLNEFLSNSLKPEEKRKSKSCEGERYSQSTNYNGLFS